MYCSFTQFEVKKWWALPLFQWHVFRSSSQANKSKGLLSIQAWHAGGMIFCTLTVWESKEDMLKFRNSGAHLLAMKLSYKMGKGKAVGWESNGMPTKAEGKEKLAQKLAWQHG